MMRITRALLVSVPLLSAGCGSDEPIEPPRPLTAESPFEFPISLWDEGIEGETRLMVHVTAAGEVDTAYVKDSSGYAEFDSAAIAGVGNLRFAPGRKGDKRVDHWVILPVKFTKEGASVTTAPTEEQGS